VTPYGFRRPMASFRLITRRCKADRYTAKPALSFDAHFAQKPRGINAVLETVLGAHLAGELFGAGKIETLVRA